MIDWRRPRRVVVIWRHHCASLHHKNATCTLSVYINAHCILNSKGSTAALTILLKSLPVLLFYIQRGEFPLVCGPLLT